MPADAVVDAQRIRGGVDTPFAMHSSTPRSRLALGVLLLACLTSLGRVPVARAEPARGVVVVPYATHELTLAEQRAADLVESALTARQARIVSMHEARDRVQALSRPPALSDDSDLDVVAREARAAIEHAAFGRSAAAQRSVQAVIDRAERALESLNRETKTARNVLDACLTLVRDSLTRGQRRDALAHAMRCRRLVPDVSPSEMLHPTSVIGVLAEADDQLRRLRMGRLTVLSEGEPGCAVYVNGRHLGVSPFRLERAAAGEYRVQVECGRTPGRVHVVELGVEPVDLVVDIDFDRALRSANRVALVYDKEPVPERLVVSHAVQLGQLVEAEEVLLLHIEGPSAVLRRVGACEGKLLGRARFPWLRAEGADSPELNRALDLLFQGRFDAEGEQAGDAMAATAPVATQPPVVGVAAAQQEVAPADELSRDESAGDLDEAGEGPKEAGEPVPPHASRDRGARARLSVGAALAVTGVGLLATGIAYERVRVRADDELLRLQQAGGSVEEQLDRYDRAAGLRWLGVGGGALLAASVPLFRMERAPSRVPWWGYAAGGAGLGLAAWGVAELVRDGGCTLYLDDACYTFRESKGRGALLLSAAAPLLTIPIDYLIAVSRAHRERAVQAHLAPRAAGLLLMVRKELW